MVDVQETAAVPPFESPGDVRLGYFLAGGFLIAAGWGLGVLANVLLHWAARSGPVVELGLRVGARWGAYGWATLLFGAFTGAFGVALLALGRASPRGPLALPGAEY